ncbi:MAG: hypothetical protein WKF84_08445 [Pyrinomonadaceae bacterium]
MISFSSAVSKIHATANPVTTRLRSFSGALTKSASFKRPFDDDGVSCIVCHSIQSAENRGIGGYVMGEPALLVKEDGTRLLEVEDKQIMEDVPSHRRAMMRPLLKSPEFCAACHKSQVPRELNDYKFLRAFAVYDEFQQSSFSKNRRTPFIHAIRRAAIPVTCSKRTRLIVTSQPRRERSSATDGPLPIPRFQPSTATKSRWQKSPSFWKKMRWA